MRKPLFALSAVFAIALTAPAWAFGCAIEPSPINCSGMPYATPQDDPRQQFNTLHSAPVYSPPTNFDVQGPYRPSQTEINTIQMQHFLGAMERQR